MGRRRLGCALLGLAAVLTAGAACGCAGAGLIGLPLGVVAEAERQEVVDPVHGAPGSGRFVAGPDGPLYVQDVGAGPAVVLVHGSAAWSGAWRDTTEALAAAGFRVVAVDLPPFGYSARPEVPTYDRPAQAQRLLAVVDALGIERAAWVGHSFGGGPTLEVVLRHPERAWGLALIDVALALDDPGTDDLVDHLLRFGPARELIVASTFTNRAATRSLLRGFVADPAAATPERVAIYQQPLDVHGTTDAIAAWLPELWSPRRPAASLDPEAIGALSLPTAVIWGDADTVTPPAQGEQLVSLLPDAQLHLLDGVGHIPLIEDPAALHGVLLPYLRGRADAASGAR